jgi:hypothetical protein
MQLIVSANGIPNQQTKIVDVAQCILQLLSFLMRQNTTLNEQAEQKARPRPLQKKMFNN